MHLLLRGAFALGMFVLAALAGPARATPFQATLSLVVDSAIGTLGAVSFVGSGSGTSTAANVTVPSGLFAGAAVVPVAGVASLSAFSVAVSGNEFGSFVPGATKLRGQMAVPGALRVMGSLGGGPDTLVSVPLRFTVHNFASAVGTQGLGENGGFLGAQGTRAYFDGWATSTYPVYSIPWGMYAYTYHLPTSLVLSYPSTVARGSDSRTPGGLGQLTLVSPIRIETSLPGTGSLLVVFGTLTLNFVPEPSTLVLLGAGAMALGFLGRGRQRRR